MIARFLSHQWIEFWRSRGKGGSIATKVVIGFFMLYFFLAAVVVGLAMDEIIQSTFPNANVILVFSGFIFYYFLIELTARLQLQELPTLSIVPYLHLKVKKSTIVNFLNIKAFINLFNLIPLLLVLPFLFKRIIPEYGSLAGAALLISVISLSIFNNYFVLYIKRKSINNALYFFGLIGLVTSLVALDYFGIFSIRSTAPFFTHLFANPYLCLIFVAMAAAIFYINSNFLFNNLYLETLQTKKSQKLRTNYTFLDRFGQVGHLAALELKLILRHKRSKSAVTMSAFFLFYGLIFYKQDLLAKDEYGTMIFAAIFMTGITILMYGQYMFGWQSAHFDGLLSLKVDLTQFIKAKFLLFTLSSTLVFALSTLYAFVSWKLILLHFVTYLFNIGVSSTIVLLFALINKKRLDLSVGNSMSFQGVGASQFVVSLPIILLPYAIYFPISALGNDYWGLIAIGAVGLIMYIMQPFWVKFIAQKLKERKYTIAQGFRE